MTDEDKALVERLRDTAEQDATYGYEARGGLFDEAADRIEAQAAEIEKLRDLLSRNIDDDPCWLDHHGYCQTHYLEEDCSVAAARAALGETE